MKKFLSIMLAILMIVTTMPMSFAVEETPDFSDAKILTKNSDGFLCVDGVEVKHEERTMLGDIWYDQYLPSGKYKLTGDIIMPAYGFIYIEEGSDVTVDLNGCTWDMYDAVYVDGKLSVYDTSADGTGEITTRSTILAKNTNGELNLYSGTVENIYGRHVFYAAYGSTINLYGGKVKSSGYTINYGLEDPNRINLYGTVLECGDGYAHFVTYLGTGYTAQSVINVADYTGEGLTVDADINSVGKMKIFEGIKNAEEAENYKVNLSSSDSVCVLEKTEYDEATGEMFAYVAGIGFTQQPSAENDYTVDFNNPDADFKWYEAEKTVLTPENTTALDSATFENGKWLHTGYEFFKVSVQAGEIIRTYTSSDSSYSLEVYAEDGSVFEYTNFIKTGNITIDADAEVTVSIASNGEWIDSAEFEFELIRTSETKETETEKKLQNPECEKTYVCKATVADNIYLSDVVTVTHSPDENGYNVTADSHSYTCSCGESINEAHTVDITTGKCGICDTDMTVIATVTDSTNTYYAADEDTLNEAVTVILESGSRTFTVELPADAEAGMIIAIRRAICDTEGVADGSINLTLKGVTSIPGTTNWDGVAFGPSDIYDEAEEFVEQELVTQLASVNLPDVTEIGAQAFYWCENLASVSAPKVQTIGKYAVACTALTSLDFPELTTISSFMITGTDTLSSAKFPEVTTIEQSGLLIGGDFKPENNPTPFPLELTAYGDITFNGSHHFNPESQNYTGKVDLVLCCDKKDDVTFHDDGTATWQVREDLSYTFKSITFKHSYIDGKCKYCEEPCPGHTGGTATCTNKAVCDICGESYGELGGHTPAENATYTDNNDGTHSFTCSVCGAAVAEVPHTLDVTTGKCSACGADMTAIATVTDSTNTYYAADEDTLNEAVTVILESGSRTFTVELPADAEAGMITAIRRAICDTEGVADGSIHLTLKGVTSIPGTTNWDGVAFGPSDIYDEAGKIVDQELVTQLASVNLPDVTEIGVQAFYFCENLASVSAPKVRTIGQDAFAFTALTSVEFPELTTIPSTMFDGTWTLSSAKFPKVKIIEQSGLLIGGNFKPENNPTPFPLELTVYGDITFNGSYHFNIDVQNYSGKVDLVLCCDKKDAVTFHDDGTATWQVREDLSYTFKSITFKHSYIDGKCQYCEEPCPGHTGGTATCTNKAVCDICGESYGELVGHTPAENATYTVNEGGTHSYACSVCEETVTESHTFTDDSCTVCKVIGGYCGAPDNDGGEESLSWVLYDGTLTVSGTGAMADYLSDAAPWEAYNEHITSIVIDEGVTGISDCSFDFCFNVEAVALPDTLKSIGRWAFANCKVLESIAIPAGVTTIGKDAFGGCYALTQINVDKANTVYKSLDGVLYSEDGKILLVYPAGKTDASFTTPDGVREIATDAFSCSEKIEELIISEGVETLADYSVFGCYALTTITLPDSIKTVDADAIGECINLTTVNVPCSWNSAPLYSFDEGVNVNIAKHDYYEYLGESYCEVCGYVCDHTDEEHAVEFAWSDFSDGSCTVDVFLKCTECDYIIDAADNSEPELVETVIPEDCSQKGGYFYTVTVTLGEKEYTDEHTVEIKSDNHVGTFSADGFCSVCGDYQPAVYNEETGIYEISNAGQLYWYADMLNTTNAEITAELTADIVIPDSAPEWEPINASFVTFNGNYHTVSGLKCADENLTYVGMFGNEVWWYVISNLHITDSYFEGSDYVGALVACMNNGGSVTNCCVTDTTVKGDGSDVGGLVGSLGYSNIINSYSTATVIGENGGVLVGYYSSYGGGGTIENCYYLSEAETEDGGKTAEQFASGEVAYILQSGVLEEEIDGETVTPHIWGQKIGTDSYPVLGGDKVYCLTNCVDEKFYSNETTVDIHDWSNNNGICANGCGTECTHGSYTDGVCDECGYECPHESYTYGVCDDCGYACEHSFTKYTETKAPTCTEAGQETSPCDYCDAVDSNEIPETGHDWSNKDGICANGCGTECTHESYTDSKCDVCGTECTHGSYTDGVCDDCGTECTHENMADGECPDCGYITKLVTVVMEDSYGDGWNENAIQICTVSDGEFIKIADATINAGKVGTYEVAVSANSILAFIWTEGGYADECSFRILVDGEEIFGTSNCYIYNTGDVIYISCDHSFEDSLCSLCGLTCGVDFEHSMNSDGECTVCGYVCSHSYTNHYCKVCGDVEDGYYAGACGEAKTNDVIWSLDSEGTLTISGTGKYSIETYNAPWYEHRDNIKNVVIEEGVTNIYETSFYGLNNAVSLSIPSTVDYIFPTYNNSFAEFKLAQGNAFYTLKDGVLFNAAQTELVMYPAKRAGETYTVPDGVKTLGYFSFYNTENLKTVNISGEVNMMVSRCFSFSSVETVNFEESEADINIDGAAFEFSRVKNVVLPESLTEIPYGLFYGCMYLENLVIGSNVTYIGKTAVLSCDMLEVLHFTGTEAQWDAITKPDSTTDEIYTIPVHFGPLEEKDGVAENCGADGHTAGLYCEECDDYVTGEVIPATGDHDWSNEDGICANGCGTECTASVTIDGEVTYYPTLDEAIDAVENCTAEDEAVVKLFSDIALGTSILFIDSGEFTFDLNGHKITSEHITIYISEYSEIKTVVTFTDSSEAQTGGVFVEKEGGPEDAYQYAALFIEKGTVTIEKGTYSTDGLGGNPISAYMSEVIINDGTFYGYTCAEYQSTMTINNGTFINTEENGYCVSCGLKANVNIYDGEFTATGYDSGALAAVQNGKLTVYGGTFTADTHLMANDKNIILTLAEGKTEGATFKNGLRASEYYDAILANSLAEGMAYWQGDKMVILSEGQKEITGGDVVVKAYSEPVYSGWNEIDGYWYYYDSETNEPVTGITRVPYPTEEIDGFKYEADKETLDYCESKGITFIDAEEGFFYFDEDGKFLSSFTGIVEYDGHTRYIDKGFMTWHPGLVEVDGEIYYFIGEEVKGGNISADGDTYIIENNGNEEYKLGEIYNFADGKLSGADGIVDGKYYEDSRLMVSNGITAVEIDGETEYIYVRSSGEIVVGRQYWVGENSFDIVPGMYEFDENGYMLGVKQTDVTGIVYKDGIYYFYENGSLAYKGLIRYTGTANNGTVYDNDWIYVRSNGQLAANRAYWTTKNDSGELKSQNYNFDETGKMIIKNGFVEENGTLYYYVNGVKQMALGLIEIEGKYYYVRSAGEVVRGREYWISNANDTGVSAQSYYFDENGVLQNPVYDKDEAVNGVVDGYYYENGKIVCGKGLVELEDGSIIYVRSNGQLATGKYWPTTLNGILPAGQYDFGTDGRLVV